MKCLRIHVIGKVQGVFFRRSTKEKADSLGLNGWVRNQLDGSVMIEVEGFETAVEELFEWCKIGSSASHVEKVHSEELPIQGYMNFSVTY